MLRFILCSLYALAGVLLLWFPGGSGFRGVCWGFLAGGDVLLALCQLLVDAVASVLLSWLCFVASCHLLVICFLSSSALILSLLCLLSLDGARF